MYERWLNQVTHLGTPKVLLVGDYILDSYVYGDAERISPEAPVAVLKVVDRQFRCGGAGSVAADIAALGGRPLCVGVVGRDENADRLRAMLTEVGADVTALFSVNDRPTTSKQRLIGLAQHRHRQQLLRIDEESDEQLGADENARLLEAYRQYLSQSDIVCLQDYRKGVLTEDLCRTMIQLAKERGKRVLVDPPLGRDYGKFTGACLITPNRKEAGMAAGMVVETLSDAERAAAILQERLRLEAAVITLDKEGAWLKTAERSEHVPTIPRMVYDVTGAGDMVLAMLAMAIAAGNDFSTAVQLANIAGGLEVEKFGTATVSVDEIVNEILSRSRGQRGKIRQMPALANDLNYHRQQKHRIVFTNGCFDVLHRGHIEYLRFCKQQGDIVVLGLNSDSSVRQIKGPTRPINNQHDRAAVLAGLESVDYIIVFEEPDPLSLIRQVRPDILVKGADWAEKGVVGREFVESYGGSVVLAPLVDGKSSTATIQKIQSLSIGTKANEPRGTTGG
ncbi:MAG: D-glycero-beta-D-manno-heptose 1-phosphate adenylyltransferase [Phycisphaerae bacterium]|nr:D-glycero-beta-D-manno-heptose 1-phosphate adenylyltransferase [Phycisphaerae bacterium]